MGQDPTSEAKNWWQTLPGLLTAAAGTITALTGLLVAIHQIGCLDRNQSPAAQVQAHPAEKNSQPLPPAPSPSAVPASVTTSRPLALPATVEVRNEDIVYKLLSANIAPYSPGKSSLKLAVRMTNNHRFPANFWSSSFRLLVDGSLQAPINLLDEVIASNSTMDGEVEFVLPADVSTVGLQMGDVGEGKPVISLNLQAPKE